MNTIVYKTTPACSLSADVYRSERNLGTILYLHGGALIWGSRKSVVGEQIPMFLDAGLNFVTADYRLAPETKLTAILTDVEDAFKWLCVRGDQFKLNTDNLFVMGSSAGGYLALLTGLFKQRKPTAIISFYGYGNILGDWYCQPSAFYCQSPLVSETEAYSVIGDVPISEGARGRFKYYLYLRQKGIWPQEVSGIHPSQVNRLKQYCPDYLADDHFPPTLLLHGNQDTDVPYEQSVQMKQRLRQLKVESELITMDGKGHVFDRDMSDPQVQLALTQVVEFMNRQV